MPSLTRALLAAALTLVAFAAVAAPASADTFGQLGAPISEFGRGTSQLYLPRAIDTDASGRIYALDDQQGTSASQGNLPTRDLIKLFSATGTHQANVLLSDGPRGSLRLYDEYRGLALDPSPPQGALAVLWTTRANLHEDDPNNSLPDDGLGRQDLVKVTVPASGGNVNCASVPSPCQFFPLSSAHIDDPPQSVAAGGPNGDVYVGRAGPDERENPKTILRFTENGAPHPQPWKAGPGSFNGYVPDVAVADNGNVYALDVKPGSEVEGRVRVFDPDGDALPPSISSGPSIPFAANRQALGELDVGPGTNPDVFVQDAHVTAYPPGPPPPPPFPGGQGFGIAQLRPQGNTFTLLRYWAESPTSGDSSAQSCRFKVQPRFARTASGEVVASEGYLGTTSQGRQSRILRFGEFGDRCGDRFRGPTANLAFSQPVVRNQAQQFDATGSSAPAGTTIDQWQFDLDGNSATGVDGYETVEDNDSGGDGVVSTTFTTLGSRTVRLRVRTEDGREGVDSATFTVRSRPPTAALSISPSAPKEGAAVTFNAGGSSDPDPDTPVTTYQFDLDGNGSFEVSGSASSVSRTFSAGSRTARVRVLDSNGDVSTVTSRSFTVAPNPSKPKPPPGDTTPPGVTLGRSAPSDGKTAQLTVTCPRSEKTCRFVFTANTAKKVKLGRRGRKKVQRLGKGSVTLKGGETKKVKFRLSSAAKKLTKRKRSLAMQVIFTATDAAGNKAEGKKRVTLKVKKKKKKR